MLAADRLMQSPRLYGTFLLWLLSELFEVMPEVGDLERPKFVFFFDEAHLLFDDAPKALLDKIEQVVRLIRSKGVGVYFITQNPLDIPKSVLGQLSNRVQHALRAFTPKDQKAVKTAADTFRPNKKFNAADAIVELGVGEALVSFLDAKGVPEPVERCFDRAAARPHRPGVGCRARRGDQGKSARRQVRAHRRSRIGLRGADRTRDRRPGDARRGAAPASRRADAASTMRRRRRRCAAHRRARGAARGSRRPNAAEPAKAAARGCARPKPPGAAARAQDAGAAQRYDRHDDHQDRGAHGDQRRRARGVEGHIRQRPQQRRAGQILRGVLGSLVK